MATGDSTTPKSSSSTGASSQPAVVSKYLLSAEDCAELFGTAEAVASLDLYLVNRCGDNRSVKIPASAMSADGVTFSYGFEGDTQSSASPSNDYYRLTNASVTISFTLRLASIASEIRSMVLPGEITTQAGSGTDKAKTKQTVTRSILRRRPAPLVLVAVAEDEPPNPEVAEGGGFVFGNTTIDYSQNIDLSYNPNDPVEIPVQMIARFTRGVQGVLAEMFY